MKQIGARQEAGRIGGTGPCGRELCCATWIKSFSSVSTNAARIQDLSLNPQKLAGMCAKLKCCLNYEVDQYMEANRKMPARDIVLQTTDSEYHLFKTDILTGQCTYSTDKNMAANLETISTERVREIVAMNKKGEKPSSLMENDKARLQKKPVDLLADTDVSRFDNKRKKRNNKAKQNRNRQNKREQNFEANDRNGEQKTDSSNNVQPTKSEQTRQDNQRQGDPKRQPRRNNKRNGRSGNRDNRPENNMPTAEE